jgi:hypothetical protein
MGRTKQHQEKTNSKYKFLVMSDLSLRFQCLMK